MRALSRLGADRLSYSLPRARYVRWRIRKVPRSSADSLKYCITSTAL
jgi:hypothetical protein